MSSESLHPAQLPLFRAAPRPESSDPVLVEPEPTPKRGRSARAPRQTPAPISPFPEPRGPRDRRPQLPSGILPILENHPELLKVIRRELPNFALPKEALGWLPRFAEWPNLIDLLPTPLTTLRKKGQLPPDWCHARETLLSKPAAHLQLALRCLHTDSHGTLRLEASTSPPLTGFPQPEGWSPPAVAAFGWLLSIPLEAAFAAWGSPEALLTSAGSQMAPLAAALLFTPECKHLTGPAITFFARFPDHGLEPILSQLTVFETQCPLAQREAEANALLMSGELPRPSLCLSLPNGLPCAAETWLGRGGPHTPSRATSYTIPVSLPTPLLPLAIHTFQAAVNQHPEAPDRPHLDQLLQSLHARIALHAWISLNGPPVPPSPPGTPPTA
jgi:hypothetical protein